MKNSDSLQELKSAWRQLSIILTIEKLGWSSKDGGLHFTRLNLKFKPVWLVPRQPEEEAKGLLSDTSDPNSKTNS